MAAKKHQTILFCPMEWGLGHTVRLVPFIEEALRHEHQCLLASDGLSLRFLRDRFPGLTWIRVPFYPVRYGRSHHFIRQLLPQVPGIFSAVRKNKRQLRRIVRDYKIDLIITDHRYGFTHRNVPSVFITNQLWLKAPPGWSFGEPWVYFIHRRILKHFTRIWVADYPETPGLSSLLTHPPNLPATVQYIGPVSRFASVIPQKPDHAASVHILAVLSGPEPQRTLLEKKLVRLLAPLNRSSLIFRGQPSAEPGKKPQYTTRGSVTLMDDAPDPQLAWWLKNTPVILCRPGNSSLSDLVTLGRTALLIPTPGQTEQEYVARQLADRNCFMTCSQDQLTTGTILSVTKFEQSNPPKLPVPDTKRWVEALQGMI